MDYKLLGQTGVQVSRLCFGTMSFGGDADEAAAQEMFSACRDRGINFFDCANVYNGGRSEEILGRFIAGSRDELVITSKCYGPMGDINAGGGNRRHILSAVEASLKRLGTDRLDVLFMHRWESRVPLEETLRALEKLVADGKVVYLGASNYSAWQIAKGLGISARNGWPRFDVIQPMYSLVKRQVESEILPLATEENLGVITYSPIGGGLLSGKYGVGRSPESGRIMTNSEYIARYSEDWVREVADRFVAYAADKGVSPVTLAVAWVAGNPAVTAPIIGGRSLRQLDPSLAAAGFDMSEDMRAEISALSRNPAPATDRLEEQLRGDV